MSVDRTHADVIREQLRHGEYLPDPCPGCLAELALDALVAERDAATERAERLTRDNDNLGDFLAAQTNTANTVRAQLAAAREALAPFLRLVETFGYALAFDEGEGLSRLTDTEWGRLRPKMHDAIVAAARAALAASGTPERNSC